MSLRFAVACLATALAAGTFALAACSQGAPTGKSGNVPTPSPGASAASSPGNVCDRKLLTLADVDGILDHPVVGTKPLAGDAQTCYFITATDAQGDGSIQVSLRGNGAATLATFTSGKMNQYANWKPLAGVGDEAVWLPDLHEVDARKSDVLCVVGVPMFMSKSLHDAGEAVQQQRLGALCNKVFAAE